MKRLSNTDTLVKKWFCVHFLCSQCVAEIHHGTSCEHSLFKGVVTSLLCKNKSHGPVIGIFILFTYYTVYITGSDESYIVFFTHIKHQGIVTFAIVQFNAMQPSVFNKFFVYVIKLWNTVWFLSFPSRVVP